VAPVTGTLSPSVERHPEYSNNSYVRDNLAVVHIYFRHLHFMRNERDELYGMVAIISNIGGLLGLCMGFSMLSAVELVYFAAKYVASVVCTRGSRGEALQGKE
jgi:hypothetical protein